MSDKHIEKPDSDASNDKTPPESSPFSPGSRKSTTDVNSGPKLTPLDKELASFQLSNNNHYSTLVQSLDVNKQDSTAKLSPTKPIDSIPLILSTENSDKLFSPLASSSRICFHAPSESESSSGKSNLSLSTKSRASTAKLPSSSKSKNTERQPRSLSCEDIFKYAVLFVLVYFVLRRSIFK